jgi:tungstate transport system substrate-binding protein
MGATLQVASEKGAYTLTDRATLLSLMDSLDLNILVEGHSSLLNICHVMIVNPERWPAVNLAGARSLAKYFMSESGQAIIEEFGVDLYGQPLFFPDAGKSEEELK